MLQSLAGRRNCQDGDWQQRLNPAAVHAGMLLAPLCLHTFSHLLEPCILSPLLRRWPVHALLFLCPA